MQNSRSLKEAFDVIWQNTKPVYRTKLFYRILSFADSGRFNEPGSRIVHIFSKILIKGANIVYYKTHEPNYTPDGTPAGVFFHSKSQSWFSLALCLRSLRKSLIQLVML